jgi:membrane protein DedA with SNARE-associated domain
VSHRLLELFSVASFDLSWLVKFLSLLLLPAAHEDVAIILGGYLVVNELMPVGIVVGTIFVGMVASDMALYLIGVGARHIPWLRELAVTERVLNFGNTLQRNLYGVAALGRLVPGAIFVIMVACGWTRVPWTRVALASVFSTSIYLPLMLYLVIVFGDALDDRVGLWTWPFLLGILVAVAFMRYRVFSFREPAKASADAPDAQPYLRRTASAMAARYRARTVQLPEFMKMGLPSRTARRPRLH